MFKTTKLIAHLYGRINPIKSGANRLNNMHRMQMISTVKTDINSQTGIATVIMDNLPVNIISMTLLKDLNETLDNLSKEKCNGLILTSSSKSTFSAGMDMNEFIDVGEEKFLKYWKLFLESIIKLHGSAYPTVAAITGHAPAGGCVLAMACEYRVMYPNFKIGLNEVIFGIIIPSWIATLMENIIQKQKTEQAILSGTLYTTDDALKIGLIDEIAMDKTEMFEKCDKYLMTMSKAQEKTRTAAKLQFHDKLLQHLINDKHEISMAFLRQLQSPYTANIIQTYLASIKKKK